MRDDVYLQENGRTIVSRLPLTSVGVYHGKVYAGTSAGLLELNGDELGDVPAMRKPVNRLVAAGGDLLDPDRRQPAPPPVIERGVANVVGPTGQRSLHPRGRNHHVARDKHLVAHPRGNGLEPYLSGEAPFPIARIMSFEKKPLYLMGRAKDEAGSTAANSGAKTFTIPTPTRFGIGANFPPKTHP